jgi:pimeloyl-ACP methyl ester carboxylesterase
VIERAVRRLLGALGVPHRYVETPVARHHVYDGPGRGGLAPVVFLPGLSDTASSIAPVALAIRREARRVIIVESAGHGLSEQAFGEYTVERHMESVTAALDALLDEPAVLVGNSLGGATALRYAVERPARVRGLFLTSPAGAVVGAEAIAEVRRAFEMRTVGDARHFVDRVVARPSRLGPAFARIMLARAGSRSVADLVRTFGDQHAIDGADLARLEVPVRLIWGRDERLLPPAALAYFKAHLPAHATIAEPSGIGHCPHLDDPARLARLIAAFTRRVSRGSPGTWS